MEQLSDIRLPVIVPPAADDRIYHLDHVPQHHRRSSLRQVADLILEPGHRLFARHGVEVVRIGGACDVDPEGSVLLIRLLNNRLPIS